MSLAIDCDFDGGNIRCLAAPAPDRIRLEIVPDAGGRFFQWFYFRVRGAAGRDCVLRIENAGGATYPDGWRDYRACASEDGEDWPRVATAYDGKVLTIRHRPAGDEVRFAYFAPYPMARHDALIAGAKESPLVTARRLGETLDGAPLDLLEVGGATPTSRTCWVIGRQHPGETMAEWWMEGFLERLLDPADALAGTLLEKARVFVVPNMNPDGSRRGHLRTNAAGINLNRAWAAPSMEESPEVYLVSRLMARTGVDFCLDVHGDEALPYNFIAGPEGIPSYSDALAHKLARFQAALVAANSGLPDRARLRRDPARQGQPRHLRQLRGRDLRLPRHDPGDALQGRGKRAGPPQRLVARALTPPRPQQPRGAGRGDRYPALTRPDQASSVAKPALGFASGKRT